MKCKDCGEDKEINQFYKDKYYKSGYKSNCKDCIKKNRNYKKNNNNNNMDDDSLLSGSLVPFFDDKFKALKSGGLTSIFIAKSRSGKTTALMEILKRIKRYYKLVIFFTNSYNAKIYDVLKALPLKKENNVIFYDDDHDEIIKNAFNMGDELRQSNNKILFVFDDYLSLSIKNSTQISKLFIQGRNNNLSVIYTSQYYSLLNPIWRQNAIINVLFQQNSIKINTMLYREFLEGKKGPLYNIVEQIEGSKQSRRNKDKKISELMDKFMSGYKKIVIDTLENEHYILS